jgi:Uma2 family endonuclease
MAVDVERARRLFTVDEYVRMWESGIFSDDDRVELIDGEVVEMSPIGHLHAAFVANLNRVLMRTVGDRAVVWIQGPVRIPPRSLPQPDLALLRPRSYKRESTTTADVLLVVEVADSSRRYDRTVKLRLYARAGIPEYWVVDAKTETLEIYRAPAGDQYAERQQPARGTTIAPLAFPDATIAIDAIFV